MQLNADKLSYISPTEAIGYHRVLNKLQQSGVVSDVEFQQSMLKIGLVRLDDGTYRDQSGRVFKMI